MKKRIAILASLPMLAMATYGQVFTQDDAQTQAFDPTVRFQTFGTTEYLKEGTTGNNSAPVGTWIWYVVNLTSGSVLGRDLTVTEVNTLKNNVSGKTDSVMFDSTGSMMADKIDTGVGELGVGRIGSEFSLGTIGGAATPTTKNVWAMLWYDANNNSTIGDLGDKFGYLNLNTLDSVGNPTLGYDFVINQNVYNQTYTVVVPEPSTYATVFGLLSLFGVAAHRRYSKKA